MKTRFDEKFFKSTRGRLVTLLRKSAMTVNELAEKLELTDNAVRAHLLSLERDGLVESAGTVRGFRKPHQSYRLTTDARHLFPKPYDSLFNRLLDVLKTRMPVNGVTGLLHEVGILIGRQKKPTGDEKLMERVDSAIATLENLGGAAYIESVSPNIVIRSQSCPFADAVAEHSETCKIAEAMLTEIVRVPVEETCDRTGIPLCAFVINLNDVA